MEVASTEVTPKTNQPDPSRATLIQAIIIWVKMICGVGLMNNPQVLSRLGWLQGPIYFLAAMLLSYYSFDVLFQAVDRSNKFTFIEIVEAMLGKAIKKIVNITLIIDYSCSLVFSAIPAWDIFQLIITELKWVERDLDLYSR